MRVNANFVTDPSYLQQLSNSGAQRALPSNESNLIATQRLGAGNAYLLGNSLHWLAGQENLIAIPAKSPDTHPLFLTGEQSSFVFWSSFLLIPLAILILGTLVWWRRR